MHVAAHLEGASCSEKAAVTPATAIRTTRISATNSCEFPQRSDARGGCLQRLHGQITSRNRVGYRSVNLGAVALAVHSADKKQVRTRSKRTNRRTGYSPRIGDGSHVERIGHDDAGIAEFTAKQAAQQAWTESGREISVERGKDNV